MPKEKECKGCSVIFMSSFNRVRCEKCKIDKPKCPHGTHKGRCKIDGCFGNEICEHKEHKQKCSICKPGVKEADKLNACIISFMKGKKIMEKTKLFILGYTSVSSLDVLYSHLNKNLIENKISIDKCQLDHIKPKSQFNLKNRDELLECCHYTNLEFIEEFKNLSKGSKWTN